MKKYTYLFIVLLAFQSCTKEVKIDIPGYTEQLVIDGYIETGQPPIVLLSRSKDIYEVTNLNTFLQGFVSGATITVSDGTTTEQLIEICTDNLPPGFGPIAAALFGVSESQLSGLHLCGYTTFNPAMFGQIGKTYELKVIFEGKTYTSSTELLPATPLVTTFWKPQVNLPNYGFSYAIVSDPPQKGDAYLWEVKRINIDSTGNPRDGRFKKTFTPVVDDRIFNGLTFEFSYENPMSFNDENIENKYKGFYQLGDSVVIKFSKMDRGVFNFLEKKYMQIQTGGSPFSSPTNVPTNIKGGALGVWAAYSTWYDTLYCVP